MVKDPEIKKILNTESTHTTFIEKVGLNCSKMHPEVYKQGKLKAARLLYKQGLFTEALTTLGQGFNIESLQRRWDGKFLVQQALKNAMKAAKTKREASLGKKQDVDSIDHMKETVTDT